jgi:hypothetical protein
MMGAEAVRKCLMRVDLDKLMVELEEQIENTRSKQTRKKITKRMKACDGSARRRPSWGCCRSKRGRSDASGTVSASAVPE